MGVKGYTEDYRNQLLEATLRVAPIVYKTKARNIWHLEDLDDFVQEALIHINKLFDTKYINLVDDSLGTIDNLVSSLLSGTFVMNRYNILTRDKYHSSQMLRLDNNEVGDSSGVWDGTTFIPITAGEYSDSLTPGQQYDKDSKMLWGKDTLHNIMLKVLSVEPIKARRYNYAGYTKELGAITLSEYDVVQLLLLGFDTQGIIKLFGFNTPETMSPANTVRRVVRQALNKLYSAVDKLDDSSIQSITMYLGTI